jgi:hypothetical protein
MVYGWLGWLGWQLGCAAVRLHGCKTSALFWLSLLGAGWLA